MEARFSSPAQRWMFLCGIVLVTAVVMLFSVKIVVADYYAGKETPEGLARAVSLEPGNARDLYLLAHYWHYSLERRDLGLAVTYYHRALTLDPRSAKIWMDLGAAYEESGDLGQAREAYAEALKSYPISADVAWRYGNFLLRQREFPNAFANIRRAVESDSKLAPAAISTCWRANPDIEMILDRALPPSRSVYLDSIRFLADQRSDDAALAVWKRLVGIKPKLELSDAFHLINELVQQDRIADAKHVWREALDRSGVSPSNESPGSVMWDGGFKSAFVSGGFGWRKTEAPGVRFDFDQEIRHSGVHSLRITFDGRENLGFNHLVQYVPVDPDTTYEFSAYLRTEDISTNSGLRFLISDSRNPAINQPTQQLTGTQPWTRVALSLTTGPKTHLVTVALRRFPSEKLDNKLSGTVWVDDVALKPMEQKRSAR
ncbi:MAG TPA: tetratricopeptide repeat protein [Candidatus Dormibacteraeota bacterium]|nr:tetratricopeptide repeat protein [Candidatus Dormibacteraeota bacterium]